MERTQEAASETRSHLSEQRAKNVDLQAILASAQRQTYFLCESLDALQADGHLTFE